MSEDQLQPQDSLVDRGVDDVLDEGYSPPEKLRGSDAKSVTPRGEREGETIEERLAQEEPDPSADLVHGVGADTLDADAMDDPGQQEALDDGEVGAERSGRLAQDTDQPDGFAVDEGISGGAASAEEAAMHDIPDDDGP